MSIFKLEPVRGVGVGQFHNAQDFVPVTMVNGVEAVEVRCGDLSRPQARNVVTASQCMPLAARVGSIADVIVGGTGRIELQSQLWRFARRQNPRHAFHGR